MMGLFKKTLEDAKDRIEKGDFDKAHDILKKHESAELHAESDLRTIIKVLADYRRGIGFGAEYSRRKEKDKAVDALEDTLKALEKLKGAINNLKRDERIKLE